MDNNTMSNFYNWLKKRDESYGGSANDPSSVDDEGDGGDGVEKRMEKPGAFPTYGNDLPITNKNKSQKIVGRTGGVQFSKKGCNCK